MDARTPNPTSMRVLIRPPIPASLPPPIPPPVPPNPHSSSSPPPPPPTPPSSQDGVVVVGFIGKRDGDVAQLIDRIIDANVFGSGGFDKTFVIDSNEIYDKVRDWFKYRRISYFHEEEKGILYLKFCWTRCPAMEDFVESRLGFDSVLEDSDFETLQGMLFMFSVCHVIIFIVEGSRFDTQLLKKFRVLQAAKHAMAPLSRSRTVPLLTSGSNLSSSSRGSLSGASKNRSPGRNASTMSRNPSAITLMSGLGSYASLFPGQCTPVTLFAFLDDFSDVNPKPSNGDSVQNSSLNQSSSLNNLSRPSLPIKGSGSSVVVLARPMAKSEGGSRKKLQSSLEAQIRFSIKKCRVLSGSETSHTGSRNSSTSNSAPLFSLDASKAVALVDRSSNQRGESLKFATGLVESVLNGKASPDTLLLENHSQSANKEDILALKEFIYRQSDILRGRGGLIANTNSGSAAGVGMVAVAAAAAAAASAASGKMYTAPELPSLETWLSSSQLILHGILSAKRGFIDESEFSKRKPRHRNAVPPLSGEGNVPKVTDPIEIAVSYLESGRGLNTKFSTLLCQRALPVAKEVYVKELPACYPTSQHQAHLEKSLRVFNSMVKGPAVQLFMEKLQDDCISIWKSGRQQCDAVSLTGKPCMHQIHEVEPEAFKSPEGSKPHSSGFVFLHACACGRSRSLRSDPFDFEAANVTSSNFPECDKLLPALRLPHGSSAEPIQPLSWTLIRVGGARYYDASKGLLQSGFCASQKFLLKWTIFLDKPKSSNVSAVSAVKQNSLRRWSGESKVDSDVEIEKPSVSLLHRGRMECGGEMKSKTVSEKISDDKKISFGRGLPNFTMRKPFSEVVAGSAAADSGFPPLQSRKQPVLGSGKGGSKQTSARERSGQQVHDESDNHVSQKIDDTSAIQETVNGYGLGVGNPILQIGTNIVPMNLDNSETIELHTSLKHVTAYVGFEHECPHGHRFILTPELLNDLSSPYTVPEEITVSSFVDQSDHKVGDHFKSGKNNRHGKVHRNSNGMNATAVGKLRNLETSKVRLANSNLYQDGHLIFSGSTKEQNGMSTHIDYAKEHEGHFQSVCPDVGRSSYTFLNRSLPLYMNCPHCSALKNKKDLLETKFAGSISQLQRIFFVTPPFPVLLATCPVIQFEASCLPPSILDREQKLQFSIGCQVILPPESFLSLRLPFVYGVQLDDGSLHPLKPFENQPELTAWITKGTMLQILSNGREIDEAVLT